MATSYAFPTNATLTAVAQDFLPTLTLEDPIHSIFPFNNVESHVVEWEQMDNYQGLMGVRGLNGPPAVVKAVGGKRYVMKPGIYGDVGVIDEEELTTRRKFGTFGERADVTELVLLRQKQIMSRYIARVRWICWTLLSTGSFSVANSQGAIIAGDSYAVQNFSAGTAWSTPSTSTPLGDFRGIVLLHRGHSIDFKRGQAFMNMTTYNRMIANTNAADLYGRRTQGLGTINNVTDFNALMMGDNLPSINIYDDGYIDSNGVYQLYISNNRVIVIGKRQDNAPIGEFQMTMNANNPNDEAGMYAKVIDRGELAVPRTIEVHSGFNGGPTMAFPSAAVIMSVGTLGA